MNSRCHYCKELYRDGATVCPHCGHNPDPHKINATISGCSSIFLLGLIGYGVWYFFYRH